MFHFFPTLILLYCAGFRVGPTIELCFLTQFSCCSCRSEPTFLNIIFFNCGCPLVYSSNNTSWYIRYQVYDRPMLSVRLFFSKNILWGRCTAVELLKGKKNLEKQVPPLWPVPKVTSSRLPKGVFSPLGQSSPCDSTETPDGRTRPPFYAGTTNSV